MNNKIVFFAIFFVVSYAAIPIPYSLSSESGIAMSLRKIAKNINSKNEDVKKRYDNEIKPIIEEIRENIQEKENLLKRISILEQDRILLQQELIFLQQQEVKLLKLKSL
ncbi:hypothetical protein CCZ01_09230 [Helicobacter monodelphidis]|uniref:hypothetical protein n=1 Tax=Helicobacter sp. 15-1451 TaxID=2004995 RepID=UPI000DCD6230|nr:hypothetical protein [Helicobacter sp. 15-1451]RAX56546.1 hypothetical protein CCZ01_09230 [Helicobacter sp. 15-1451]